MAVDIIYGSMHLKYVSAINLTTSAIKLKTDTYFKCFDQYIISTTIAYLKSFSYLNWCLFLL